MHLKLVENDGDGSNQINFVFVGMGCTKDRKADECFLVLAVQTTLFNRDIFYKLFWEMPKFGKGACRNCYLCHIIMYPVSLVLCPFADCPYPFVNPAQA